MTDTSSAPAYRAFLLDPAGKVFAAVALIDATNDDEARAKGLELVDGHGVEVWDGARVVARFPVDQEAGR